jgi:myo-inositol-1(or 4)-monophosphatase
LGDTPKHARPALPIWRHTLNATDRLRDLARRATLEGGRVIRESGTVGEVEEKGSGDYVTRVDRAAEDAITRVLLAEDPDSHVVGEELGGARSDRYWLVDPLDGTTNFVHGLPVVGVSVALIERGRPTVGAVHAPFLGTSFTAARGFGAEQEGRPLHVSSRDPTEAVVATGFPFRYKHRLPEYRRVLLPALAAFEDLRRAGAASLDLAWTAAGVFDGFFELGLSPWDVAAGALLIEEAGGVVTDWTGGGDYLSGDVLAGSPGVHQALRDLASDRPGQPGSD